jgi:hypothetical protein
MNTIPIEDFLNKARIAIKSNQKTFTMTIKEAADLQNSLSVVMTVIAGGLYQTIADNTNAAPTKINMDGGRF